LLLLIRPALAAVAAGNTCILTLSEALPATTEVLLELVPKYFDPSAVTAVAGGKEQNTKLLKLSFDFIFFTGSTVVGKIVARAAAENLTPVLLELGGMNPAVVDETANIRDAAKKIVWGKMAWGGQWCTSPGYAYVHESVADAFVAAAKKALVELFGDDPKSNSDYSRIINAHAVDRLASLIDPAKVIAGGKSDPDAHYLDSTLLYPITWDDKVMEDEVFGPILPILTYKSLDEAFARIAATPASACGFHLQPRPEDHRSVHRRAVLWWGRGEPGERSPVRRDHAVRRHWIRWVGPLLRQVWLRRAHARQVDADLAARCRNRSPVPALYTREKRRAQAVV
jgi:aldehyde dehydrogenase (NAD+)